MESWDCARVVPMPARTVVVVGSEPGSEPGPEPGVDIDAVAGLVGARNGELVVLSVGWPPTPAQRRAVDGAMQAAAERGFACSAHLVWSAGEIEDHLQPHDDVLVTSPSPLPTEVPAFA